MLKRKNIFTGIVSVVLGSILVAVLLVGILVATNYQHLGRLVQVAFLVNNHYLGEVNFVQLVDGATRGIVDSLEDPYSTYLSEEEMKELSIHVDGTYGGIGLEIDLTEDKQMVVVAPIKGTPAERAGVKTGDIIVTVDGENTQELGYVQSVYRMRGEPGTEVVLGIYRQELDDLIQVTVPREEITLPSVSGRLLEDSAFPLGYVHLSHFNRNTTELEMRETLQQLKGSGMQGLILDLRGNPGGNLNTAVAVAGLFVEQGPLVRVVHKNGQEEVWETSPEDPDRVKLPLVVLINEGSASASEIVAGAIRDHGVGTLVGMPTFGKGRVQTVFSLDGGAGLKLTTDKYLTPNGHDIHQKGIEPDLKVERDPENREDLQLKRAVELFQEASVGQPAA